MPGKNTGCGAGGAAAVTPPIYLRPGLVSGLPAGVVRGGEALFAAGPCTGLSAGGRTGLGLFYPLTWLIALLEVPYAILVIQLLAVLIGMFGMLVYAR